MFDDFANPCTILAAEFSTSGCRPSSRTCFPPVVGLVRGLIRKVVHVDQATLEKCQKIIGYEFSDPGLLKLALTHASVAASRTESNERLEFLGDAVLALVVCQELYQHKDKLLEGEMTKIKSAVVSGQTCAKIADGIGISKLAMVSKGVGDRNGPPQSVSAALFEAIIGAIYLDGGLDAARQFVRPGVRPYLEEAMATAHQENYKSMLQQYAQRRWGKTPEYLLLDEKGPDHSKAFETAVAIDGAHFPTAWGRTKKDAEQEAARLALIQLGLLPDKK